MKVFYVGDGKHDVGAPDPSGQPHRAAGVVPGLVRRLCHVDDEASLAVRWAQIPRLSPTKKRGYQHKVRGAMLLASRYDCGAVICVVDRDGDADRLDAMVAGTVNRDRWTEALKVVCGQAVESGEAWVLADRRALAEVLGLAEDDVRRVVPNGSPEKLKQTSGKVEKRPKELVARVAELAHEEDSVTLRERVVAVSDLAVLETECPLGFEPFARALRSTLSA